MNDEQLFANYVAGDESALTELMERYKIPIARFVARQFRGRKEITVQVLRATWIHVERNKLRFDPSVRPFSAWLFVITNKLVELKRKAMAA